VVINNAGYGHFGFVEELSEAEARAQIETNVFGALWTTQAALPLLRGQGSGHILQVSSIGGVVAFPSLGIYHASKWALEGLTEALAQEVRPFGVHTTLIEPSVYATDWGGSSSVQSEPNPAYEPMRQAMAQRSAENSGAPVAKDSVPAILAAVDADEPPSRLLLTSQAVQIVVPQVEERVRGWRAWADTSALADAKA
jgi:NAD(P)-dependent dehydrogenase (short-subunit alcohol dehydrogenase family)